MKRYDGRRTTSGPNEVFVVDDDGRYALDPRFDLYRHSPDGFEWGYGGSGPSQLALAILADLTGDDSIALSLYHDFKWAHIATLDRDSWSLDGAMVAEWVRIRRTERLGG